MIDYIRIIKEAEQHSKTLIEKGFDNLDFRVISLDLGRQSGKTHSLKELIEDSIKNGDKVLSIHSRCYLGDDRRKNASDFARSSYVHVKHILKNPLLAKNCRYVIFDDYGMDEKDKDVVKELVALLKDKNVGMIILAGRVL